MHIPRAVPPRASDTRATKFYLGSSILVIVLLIVLFATGCSTTRASQTDPNAGKASSSKPPESVTPPPQIMNLVQFGEVYSWADGVSVSIGQPFSYQASELSAGSVEGQPQVAFEMILTNGSDSTFSPSAYYTLSSGGVESSQIFDMSNELGDIGATPMTTMLPGDTVKWYAAYSVADPNSITMAITPSFTHDEALFTNRQP